MNRREAMVRAGLVSGWWGLGGGASSGLGQEPAKKKVTDPGPYHPTVAELAEIDAATIRLGKLVQELRGKLGDGAAGRDLLADVEVFHKAAVWIVRHGEFREGKDVGRTLASLERGRARAEDVLAGRKPWASEPFGVMKPGSVPRGYRSKVDGSVQPYAVVLSPPTDEDKPPRLRLDVVLHGRNDKLHEVRFLDDHREGKAPPAGSEPGVVTLHVFGRTNNAYRWAGEADVYEAIDAVRRNYRIDDRRIVLRGFSMGGAGAWHLGLHNPGFWASVEAGAGFSETMNYAKLKDPSEVIRKGLHIYDAVDYARNATMVPIIGYGGENDPQRQASLNIEDALKAKGMTMTTEGLVTKGFGIPFNRIVGKGMGHAVDKDSAALIKAFHDEHVAAHAVKSDPNRIAFTTWTLRYNTAAWLRIERLTEHYKEATLDATVAKNRAAVRTKNVSVLAVDRFAVHAIWIDDGKEILLNGVADEFMPDVYFRKTADGWEALDHDQSLAIIRNERGEKAHGVQGPIDDAFTAPFLCVRGSGKPWSPAVHEWAMARLARFGETWNRSLRGDLTVKADVDVSEEDIATKHLILFGDPGSNELIARALPGLPLTWDETTLGLDGKHPAADHAPVLITSSPLNRGRYLVLNSGHTFGPDAFKGSNALLYPRLGDYAVFHIGAADEVRVGGYFNEKWRKG